MTTHRVPTSVVIAVLAAASTVSLAGKDRRLHDEHTITRRLAFSGSSPRTLDARTLSGSIRVIGDDGADVRLEARQKIEADTDDALREAQRAVTVDGRENGATVEIVVREEGRQTCGDSGRDNRGPAWWDRNRYDASVDLSIRVPRDVRVRLCTVNGSEAVVEGTQGDFDVTGVNGRIRLVDMRGSGRAMTVNGGIEASFSRAPQNASEFKTVNGDIAVTMPRDLAADLRMKTFNGNLYSDFDVTRLPQTLEPTRRNGVPKYVYKTRGFTSMRVGSGGPELTFDTLNGDVKILRAAR